MKITQKMIDDWRHPEGYVDFNGNPDYAYYTHKYFHYEGGIAIVRSERGAVIAVATIASGGNRPNKRCYCPQWQYVDQDRAAMDLVHYLTGPALPDSDFSLEEIAKAERIIARMG